MRLNTDYTKLSSVMAEHGHSRTSEKYSFVPTFKVIQQLERTGWFVSDCRETNAGKDRQGYQKHMIRFRRSEDVGRTLNVNELISEILLTNAHDAGAAFNLTAALFRCFCSNQCVTSDATIASHRVLHKGFNQEQILDAVYNIVEDTPKVLASVNMFKNIELSVQEQTAFADSALDIATSSEDRWGKYDKDETIKNLLVPRRKADTDGNLWNTFNIVQEKFLKGGRFMEEKKQNDYQWRGKVKKTKQIKSIDKDVKLNKALWTLTEKMAELKTESY